MLQRVCVVHYEVRSLAVCASSNKSYERSETHRFEVPRMLLDDPLELENYVMKSKDR